MPVSSSTTSSAGSPGSRIFIVGGYLFGNIPMVKRNFTLVIMVIIVVSVLPGVVEFVASSPHAGRDAFVG